MCRALLEELGTRWSTPSHPHSAHGPGVPRGLQQSGDLGQTDNRDWLSLRSGRPLKLGFWYILCPEEVLRW